jgi:hypothetical protein
VNPNPYPFHSLFDKLRSFGYEIAALPYEEWRNKLLDTMMVGDSSAGEDANNALFPVVSVFGVDWHRDLTNPTMDMSNIRECVTDPAIVCPDIGALAFLYTSYLIQCRFLDAPAYKEELQINFAAIGKGVHDQVERLTRTNRS